MTCFLELYMSGTTQLYLGHFLLTNLLLDCLKKSAPSRIIVVTSGSYIQGKIYKDDLNLDKSYGRWKGYTQSKLANILFTLHLTKMLKGTKVTANSCHPGFVRTELSRHVFSKEFASMIEPIYQFFSKTPKIGAQTLIRLALDPVLENSSGGYYLDTIKFPVLRRARDKKTAEWLWNASEEMVGLKPKQKSFNSSNTNSSIIGKEQKSASIKNKPLESVDKKMS